MNKKMKDLLIYLVQLALMIVVTYIIFTQVVRPIRVVGPSMTPTVHGGDFAFTNVIALRIDDIERFDVVVIDCEQLDENIIKRVIGLPGEKIEYKDDQLYVDGTAVAEDFLDDKFMGEAMFSHKVDLFTSDFSFTVPKGEYFVMGDNRLNSQDSRNLGTFIKAEMIGIGGVTIYPFSHFDWIK